MLSDLSSGYIAYNRENLYFNSHASTAQTQLGNKIIIPLLVTQKLSLP